MKPSTFKEGVEKEFDYISKRVIRDERKNYMKHLSSLSKHETSFSMIDDHTLNKFSTKDRKPSDYHTFFIDGQPIQIENDLLAEGLAQLTSRKREIILLYYFLDLGAQEVADMLNLNRSTVYRHRKDALTFIKNFMEERANEHSP